MSVLGAQKGESIFLYCVRVYITSLFSLRSLTRTLICIYYFQVQSFSGLSSVENISTRVYFPGDCDRRCLTTPYLGFPPNTSFLPPPILSSGIACGSKCGSKFLVLTTNQPLQAGFQLCGHLAFSFLSSANSIPIYPLLSIFQKFIDILHPPSLITHFICPYGFIPFYMLLIILGNLRKQR